jgi:hypothetical protein
MLPGSLHHEGFNRKLFFRYAVFGVTLAVGLLPILAVNTSLYGAPFTIPQGEGFVRWSDPQIIPLLFSAKNGFFSYHPIYLLGAVGFTFSLFKREYDNMPIFFGIALIFIAQVYINSTVEDWWAGHSFGQRRLLFSLPLFVFGTSSLLDTFKKHLAGVYKYFIPIFVFSGTVLWVYLMMIHVFLWDYNKPHNIYKWMFYYAPTILNDYFHP